MYHIAPTQKIKSYVAIYAAEYMTWLTDYREVSRQDTQSRSLYEIVCKENLPLSKNFNISNFGGGVAKLIVPQKKDQFS